MIGDTCGVDRVTIIEIARRSAGLSQGELARLARTTQSAVSDYERRRKSPALAVTERLLAAAGSDVMVVPAVEFEQHDHTEVGAFLVANRLWPLLPPLCFDRVRLRDRGGAGEVVWDLAVRADRILLYELVLCDGTADAILACVDGALLVEAWPDMDLPAPIRKAWQPLIDEAKGSAHRRSTIRNADYVPGTQPT
jgi:transcriptional regulator with XRE-family HTH domain